MNASFSKNVIVRIIILFTPVFIISTITLVVFLSAYKKLDIENIYESQQNILTLQKQKTSTSFQGIFSDLLFLKNSETFKQYINDPYRNSFQLVQLLLNFSENKKIYDQIRLLDAKGKEEIRINYSGGKAYQVPKSRLADKSNRHYFKYTEPLNSDTLYISRIDLNMEHGEVEKPIKPTIRFAVPVFDKNNQFRGALVLNFLAKYVLRTISEHETLAYGELSLLDSTGNWLISEKPENEFAFMLGNDSSFSNSYPEVWQDIYLKEHGIYQSSENDIFFYDTLRPVPTLASEEADIVDIFLSSEMKYTPADYHWKIITHLTPDFFNNRYRSINIFSYSVYAAVNIALLLTSMLIAYVRTKQKYMESEHKKLQSAYIKEIEESSKMLEHQVEQIHELVHILCHDLVNPIGCVMSAIELMDEFKEYNERYTMHASSALQEALDIINMVRNIRALDAGKKELELESVNLSEAVRKSLTLISSNIADKNITVKTDVPEGIAVTAEKTSLINSVINNILTNAIKFSERGSSIDIYTDVTDSKVTLNISDHGKGIPKDMIDNLFNSSMPTSRPGTEGESGTGFGMPLVKKFMNRYGGDIHVFSVEEKEGSTDRGTKISLMFIKA